MSLFKKNTPRTLFNLLYVFLPFAYYLSKGLFIIALIVIYLLLFMDHTDKRNIIIDLYIVSFSFFGISIFGIKLTYLALIVIFTWEFFHVKVNLVNSNTLLIYVFIIYIFISILIRKMFFVQQSIEVWTEFTRYFFCLITLLIYSQSFILDSAIKIKKSLISLDRMAWLITIQTLVMSLCFKLYGAQTNFQSGIFTVSTFDSTGLVQQGINNFESRPSGFFSDPNKLMAFIFIMLLARKIIAGSAYANLKKELIYLLCGIVTQSRAAFIIVMLLTVIYCIRKTFGKNAIVGYSMFLSVMVIIVLILNYLNISITGIIDNIFRWLLNMVGRDRTLALDSGLQNDGRAIIWRKAVKFIKIKPLFGFGLQSEGMLLPYPTHNTIIQLLLDSGIVGLIIYLFGILKIIVGKINLMDFFVLAVIPMLVLDLANFNILFFVLGLSLAKSKKSFVKI